MTETQTSLARRVVACKGWRWMPGMLAVEWAAPGMGLTGGRPVRVERWHEVGVWLPDLSDPATVGCLLALVREAWGDPALYCVQDLDGAGWWAVGRWEHAFALRGRWATTQAEALVAALEAAP